MVVSCDVFDRNIEKEFYFKYKNKCKTKKKKAKATRGGCHYRRTFSHRLLYDASQIRHFVHIERLWQPCIERVYWRRFPRAFAPFVSLGLILAILAVFQAFLLGFYLIW